jgi:hypothetical protein
VRAPRSGADAALAERPAIRQMHGVAGNRQRVASVPRLPRLAILLWCALLSGTSPSAGQLAAGEVTGTVVDEAGRPVAAVSVTLEGAALRAPR